MTTAASQEVEQKLTEPRIDKEQSFEDKVTAVNRILATDSG